MLGSNLGLWLNCGHRLLSPELEDSTSYQEDDDQLITTCPRCQHMQPTSGSREVLAELFCRVTLREAREALAVPYHPGPPTYDPSLLEEIEGAGSLWGVRQVLTREPAPARPTWAETMIEAMDRVEVDPHFGESPPWPLRLELWWMRRCLRWQARDGVRLDIRVPTVTSP